MPTYADGVAGEAKGVGLLDFDAFVSGVGGLDGCDGGWAEGRWVVHDDTAFEGGEGGVEVVEAGVDEFEGDDGDVPGVT